MAKLRVGTSYWLDAFSGKPPRYPTLRGRHEVDVAVIGGGLTGCVAAYKFAQAGLHVAMLEARQVGRGSTAASTALVMQEPDLDFRDLASRYGTRRARRIWQWSAASLRGLVRLVRALRIDAALEHVPSVYWT